MAVITPPNFAALAPESLDLDNDLMSVWDVTSPAQAKKISPRGFAKANGSGRHNVKNYGVAVGDGSDATAAFQAAAAACTTRGDVIVVPPGEYLLTANYLASLGTAAGDWGVWGCTTELAGRIVTRVPLVVPNGHKIIGVGNHAWNSASPSGAEIWAAGSGWVGTRLVQLGRDDYPVPGAGVAYPDGTYIENICVNCRSIAGIVGVYSNSIQERCGLRDCVVLNAKATGVQFEPGTNISPANYTIERTDVVMVDTSPSYGMDLFGSNVRVVKCTAICAHTTTSGVSAFRVSGHTFTLENCHFEGFTVGVDIDVQTAHYWGWGFLVNGLTGYNTATQPAINALAQVRARSGTHVWNVSLRRLSLSVYNSAVYLVADDINTAGTGNCNVTAASDRLTLGEYSFGGSKVPTDTAVTVVKPVYRSDHRGVGAVTLAAGSTANLDVGNVNVIRITANIAGSTLTSVAGGYLGRELVVVNVGSSGNLVLQHNSATGVDANKILGAGNLDVTLLPGEASVLRYGIGSNTSRWYATQF